MPRKNETHPDPSGLREDEFKETKEEEQDRHSARAAGGELPGYKDQVRTVKPPPKPEHNRASGGNSNANPPVGGSSAVTVPMAEGIPIDDGEVDPPPRPQLQAVIPTLQQNNPRQGMDLRKHMIWGAVILGSIVTVAVVVFLIVSGNSRTEPSPTTQLVAPPTAPTPAPANPPTSNPVVEPPPNPPPTNQPRPPPTPQPRPPPTLRPTDSPVEAAAAIGWVLALDDESCNTACTSAGGSCNAAGNNRVDDAATVTYVAEDILGLTCADTDGTDEGEDPSLHVPSSTCYYQTGNHVCSVSQKSLRNMCCCSDNLADCPVSA